MAMLKLTRLPVCKTKEYVLEGLLRRLSVQKQFVKETSKDKLRVDHGSISDGQGAVLERLEQEQHRQRQEILKQGYTIEKQGAELERLEHEQHRQKQEILKQEYTIGLATMRGGRMPQWSLYVNFIRSTVSAFLQPIWMKIEALIYPRISCFDWNPKQVISILGINNEFVTRLELDDEKKAHHPWHYYVENIIEGEENLQLKEDGYLEESGLDGLIKNLQKIGFTEEGAKNIAERIPTDFIDTQLPSYWAIKYLDFVRLYHPLLTSCPPYPYGVDEFDEWFEENVPLDKRSEPDGSQASELSHWPVKMINVTAEKGDTEVEQFLKKLKDKAGYELWFHGTSHQSAQSILKSGIKLGVGNVKQDFSSGDGFYLGTSFENARKWRQEERYQAVVVLKVKKDLVDPDKEHGLDVTEDTELWGKIIRLCRGGYEDTNLKNELLGGITFIRGPMCANPKAVIDIGEPPKAFEESKGIQLCVRDANYAVKIGSIQNVAGVIFYK